MPISLRVENDYKTIITQETGIAPSGDVNFTVLSPPKNKNGYIVVSPDNAILKEIMYFHDVIGNTIYVYGVNRQGAKEHTQSETVQINDVAEIFNFFSDNISTCFSITKTSNTNITVYGGIVYYNGNPVTVADATFTVANGNNYVKYDYASNTISVDQVNAGNIKAVVVVAGGTITSITYQVAKESYNDFAVSLTGALPAQAGNAGKSLMTDGTIASWGKSNALRTGLTPNSFISTNGTGDEGYSTGGLLPTGAITLWSTITAPTGYLLCDGALVSRSTYSALFSIVATTYGVGDGSTTFALPNLKGRVAVGRDAGQGEFDNMGEVGGAKTHTLTTSEIPGHTHTIPSANGGSSGSGSTYAQAENSGNGGNFTTSNGNGGGQSHNNLQPYLVLNYIIKT